MLSIIHISNNDINGGAARAAYRIHQCLKEQENDYEINSIMRVMKKYSDDPTVIESNLKGKLKLWQRIRPRVSLIIKKSLHTSNEIAHNIAFPDTGILKELNNLCKKSDERIFHLHWIGDNTISIEEVARLKGKIFWTLHDQWPFCGAEHYTFPPIDKNGSRYEDIRYQMHYSKSSRPYYENGFDLNRWTWKRKKKNWKQPFHIVATSNWMANCAKQSSLMHDWPISLIPYPINLREWFPIDKFLARKILGIPLDKKIILFGAIKGTKDKRKGAFFLEEALFLLNKSNNKQNIENQIKILVFGESSNKRSIHNLPVEFLGNFNDNISLRVIYSCADVMVVPSIQEAFGQTASEAHACGTPVVAFRIGGLIDIVSHKKTGYLANPYDANSLALGIKWVIEDEERNKKLSRSARIKAEQKWDSRIIAKEYINAYHSEN
tara:strand:+ start:907 stop:2214 length:1308 start_codon:yes stop_codon:yes gene_type:complete